MLDSSSFRIAHISDLHLGGKPSVQGWKDRALHPFIGTAGMLLSIGVGHCREHMETYQLPSLFALVRHFRERKSHYDGIVITGDLSSTGEEGDIAVAVDMVRGTHPITMREVGGGGGWLPPEKVLLLPGNHDRYLGRAALPKSEHFEAKRNFSSNWSCGLAGCGDSGRVDLVVKSVFNGNGDELVVVMADFSFSMENRPWHAYAYLGRGMAEAGLLKRMVDATIANRARGAAVVWATHYSIGEKHWFLRLKNEKCVLRAARKAGINVILSGHSHKAAVSAEKAGDWYIKVVKAGSATTHEDRTRLAPSFYELDIKVDGEKVYVHRHKLYRMVESAGGAFGRYEFKYMPEPLEKPI